MLFIPHYYEHIDLGPNQLLSALLNTCKDDLVFRFREVVPHKKAQSVVNQSLPVVKEICMIDDWEVIA